MSSTSEIQAKFIERNKGAATVRDIIVGEPPKMHRNPSDLAKGLEILDNR